MIDLETLKANTDLLALAGHDTSLKKIATTGGGEYAGPCPFCGGVDRFRVQPESRRWLCRNCTGGKWQDAIAYVQKRDGCDFKQACQALGAGDLPARHDRPAPPPPAPAYQAPAGDWQTWAKQAIDASERALWLDPERKALDYLRRRGLRDETIKRFRLGYCPGGKWGELYIPRGVLIPCEAGGDVWYIKIRLLPDVPCKCQRCQAPMPGPGTCPKCGHVTKYAGVKGNRPAAIFGADRLLGARSAWVVEGEFDVLTLAQALGDVLPVVSFGSATNRPDLAAWGAYLIGPEVFIATYDNDPAGEAGLAALVNLTDRVKLAPLPEGVKDVNDLALSGADLWAWALPYLEAYTAQPMPSNKSNYQ